MYCGIYLGRGMCQYKTITSEKAVHGKSISGLSTYSKTGSFGRRSDGLTDCGGEGEGECCRLQSLVGARPGKKEEREYCWGIHQLDKPLFCDPDS